MRQGAVIAGKYRLRRLIGEGAVGEVWAAVNVRTEREVALKLIVGADRELRERAIREARACGRVNHRNVVEIFDAGESEQGDPFLIMQLLEGETVSDRLKREKRIAPARAAVIALDAARGLSAAHVAGIIHRDLKPSNIFLHREQETGLELVKLVDFGVSKMLWSGGPPTTRTGDIVGSPAYMSPEQARADRALDHRTDIWSLGVVLFEMLTGDRPFPSRNIGVISEIVSLPIPSAAERVPGLDPRLAEIVARCLERDLDRRIQTSQELAALLRPCAAAEDVWGSSDSWRKPQVPPQTSNEDLIATLALGSSALPNALAAALAQAPSAPQPFRPVPTTLVDPSRPQQARPSGAAPFRAPIPTQDDLDDEVSTAQMDKSPVRETSQKPAMAPSFSPSAAPPAPSHELAPPLVVAAPEPRFPNRKGDGTLFLVGVVGTLTVVFVVAAAISFWLLREPPKAGADPAPLTASAAPRLAPSASAPASVMPR